MSLLGLGARCSSVVRAFAHGAMGRHGVIELFLVPASAPKLDAVCVIQSVG